MGAVSECSPSDLAAQLMDFFPDASADLCVELIKRSGNDLERAAAMMLGDVVAPSNSSPHLAVDADASQDGGAGKRVREVVNLDSDDEDAPAQKKERGHEQQQQRQKQQLASSRPSDPCCSGRATSDDGRQQGSWKVLTYNIWFQESVQCFARMAAIGEIIEKEDPEFVLLQEVTPLLLQALKSLDFAEGFRWSDPPPGVSYFTMILVARRVGSCTFSRRRFPNSR